MPRPRRLTPQPRLPSPTVIGAWQRPRPCVAGSPCQPSVRGHEGPERAEQCLQIGVVSVCETRRVKIRIPVTNVAELVRRKAGQVGEGVALVDGDRRVTWAELDQLVDAHARGLSAAGLVAGHRVALSLRNSLEFVVSYLSVLRAGMVAVPFSPLSTTGEVARMLADSGARVCVCERATVEAVRVAVSGDVQAPQSSGGDELPRFCLLYTSPSPRDGLLSRMPSSA